MEASSLPVLVASQVSSSLGSGTAAVSPGALAGGDFAAVLGAMDLTALTTEQRAALGQLFADPDAVLAPLADSSGKPLPPAAMRGLLEALGVDVETALPTDDVAAQVTQSALLTSGPVDEGTAVPVQLAALLAMLLPAEAAPAGPQRPALPPSPAGGGPEAVADPAQLVRLLRDGDDPARVVDAAEPQRPVATAGLAQLPHRAAQLAEPTDAGLRSPAGLHAVGESAVDSVRADGGGGDPGRALLSTLQGALASPARAELAPSRAAGQLPETVSLPVGERGWDRAFGERVLWLVGQHVQAAEIRLNPQHLGPVDVRLSLHGQDASVSFTVGHAATRDAIEQAIPRLRELFAEQQLQIVNVDVGQRDAANQASQGDRWRNDPRSSAGTPSAPEGMRAEPSERARPAGPSGLVDEYA